MNTYPTTSPHTTTVNTEKDTLNRERERIRMRERVNCCTLLEQIVDIKKDRQTDMNRLLDRQIT